MSSSSEARRSFAAEPLGDKSVTDLAGVCEALGARLKAAGFDEASTVLGQFLVMKKDTDLFKDWMVSIFDANATQVADCSQCLNDWCDVFL